jgi:hypothetical protein
MKNFDAKRYLFKVFKVNRRHFEDKNQIVKSHSHEFEDEVEIECLKTI